MSRRRVPLAGGPVLVYTEVTSLTSAPSAATDGYALVADEGDQLGRRNAAPMMLEMRFVTPPGEEAVVKVWYYHPEDDSGTWYEHTTLKVTIADELATRRVDCHRNATRVAIQVTPSGTCFAAIDAVNDIYDDDTVVLRDGTTDDWATIRNTVTGGAATDNVVVVQHQDTAAAIQPAGDVNTRALWTKLTNGTVDALLKAADAAATATSVVLGVQHIDDAGAVQPAGDTMARGIFARLTNGTLEALLKAANAAGAVDSTVLGVQHIDDTGAVQPAGDANTRALWTKLTNGTVDALLKAANAAATATSVVLGVQQIDGTGAVPPAGNVNTNAPFAKLTDGATEVAYKAADAATAATTVVTPVQHVGADGNALPSGDSTDPVSVTDSSAASALKGINHSLLAAKDSLGIYHSNLDFTAAFATATTLDLAGMGFDPSVEDFVSVEQITSAGVRTTYLPSDKAFSWAAGVAGAGVLTVANVAFDATDEFVVKVRGPQRAYDSTTDTLSTIECAPVREQGETTGVYDVTGGTDDTYNEYLDMDGVRQYTLKTLLDNGSGTVSLSVAYSVDTDTDLTTRDYTPATLAEFGQATFTAADMPGGGDALMLQRDGGDLEITSVRVRIVADTGAVNDGGWHVKIRKGY